MNIVIHAFHIWTNNIIHGMHMLVYLIYAVCQLGASGLCTLARFSYTADKGEVQEPCANTNVFFCQFRRGLPYCRYGVAKLIL